MGPLSEEGHKAQTSFFVCNLWEGLILESNKKNIADDNNIACILIFRVLRKACLDLHLQVDMLDEGLIYHFFLL